MEVTGRIIIALPEVSGTSKAGNAWKKREYVLETQEQYPRKVFFNFFGDRADQFPMNVGDLVTVSFDIESREFNGRWYTDIRAWKAEPAQAATSASTGVNPVMPGAVPPPAAPMGMPQSDPGDDLPF